MCANDIKYCYKEPYFRRDTEWDGISDISACLVCFGVFQRTQFRRYLDLPKRNRNTGTKPKYRNETLKLQGNIYRYTVAMLIYRNGLLIIITLWNNE